MKLNKLKQLANGYSKEQSLNQILKYEGYNEVTIDQFVDILYHSLNLFKDDVDLERNGLFYLMNDYNYDRPPAFSINKIIKYVKYILEDKEIDQEEYEITLDEYSYDILAWVMDLGSNIGFEGELVEEYFIEKI